MDEKVLFSFVAWCFAFKTRCLKLVRVVQGTAAVGWISYLSDYDLVSCVTKNVFPQSVVTRASAAQFSSVTDRSCHSFLCILVKHVKLAILC